MILLGTTDFASTLSVLSDHHLEAEGVVLVDRSARCVQLPRLELVVLEGDSPQRTVLREAESTLKLTSKLQNCDRDENFVGREKIDAYYCTQGARKGNRNGKIHYLPVAAQLILEFVSTLS